MAERRGALASLLSDLELEDGPLVGFVCPDCLLVADSDAALHEL